MSTNDQGQAMHITWLGQGPRVVLVHGSQWRHPDKNFGPQRALADRFELALMHRRGYGESPPAQRDVAFEPDVGDLGALLAASPNGAHVIGESYGGWVALLAAQRWPARIRSLTLIEPIAFSLAQHHPAVRDLVAALQPVFAQARPEQAEQFAAGFLSVMQNKPITPRPISDESRQAVLAMLSEARTWDLTADFSDLARQTFPKLVVSGGWHPAFEAICDVVAQKIQAQHIVIPGHGHSPQEAEAGRPFNAAWLELVSGAA